MKIYILIGHYLQEEGYKILRAYNDKNAATKDLEMIQEVDVAGREWKIEEVDFFDNHPKPSIE